MTVSGEQQVWIGTSWKMNKTIGEACEYAEGLAATPIPAGVQAFVLPAYTALAAVRDRLAAVPQVLVGAQNAHFAPEGGSTGEVSMRMVKDAGARLVEIGHAERRREFGETDQTAALKTRAALALRGQLERTRRQLEADRSRKTALLTSIFVP